MQFENKRPNIIIRNSVNLSDIEISFLKLFVIDVRVERIVPESFFMKPKVRNFFIDAQNSISREGEFVTTKQLLFLNLEIRDHL